MGSATEYTSERGEEMERKTDRQGGNYTAEKQKDLTFETCFFTREQISHS